MSQQTITNESRLRPDTLITSIVILLGVSLLQRSVGFARSIFFCRSLAIEELGHWEMAYSFLLLAAPVAVLGLPGSFGRYLERYRQQGQLHTFLRRTAIWTGTLAFAAVTLILINRHAFSTWVFGSNEQSQLICLVAISLAIIILHHFLEALFAALRMFRVVSTMQFCQSIGFAVLSIALLTFWKNEAASIVIGYAVACLVTDVASLVWMRSRVAQQTKTDEPMSHRMFWPVLLKFAAWLWVCNVLYQLFGVVDRYMIIHHSGLGNAEALQQIGFYHTSCILPMLIVSVANLLTGVILPYLSRDWEAGHKRRVAQQLNLILKLSAIGMAVVAGVMLWLGPMMFQQIFGNKFNAGVEVMPWTLVFCVWFALFLIAQNYLCCAEKNRWISLPLGLGLVTNVGLNLVLLPRFGLLGAVLATAGGTAVALIALLMLSRKFGMLVDRGVLLCMTLPLAVGFGVEAFFFTLLGVLVLSVATNVIFNNRQRAVLRSRFRLVVSQGRQLIRQTRSAHADSQTVAT